MAGRFAVAVAVAMAATGVSCPGHEEHDQCIVAVRERTWPDVAKRCTAPIDRARRVLGLAWGALDDHKRDEALALARGLEQTALAADAAYLAGYAYGQGDGPDDDAKSEEQFRIALDGYQRAGRHRDASRAANFLGRIASAASRYEEALEFAALAVDEASRSGDRRLQGGAETGLAETYDAIGMVEEAREAFLRAEELVTPWPGDLAFAYFKHGVFLLDLNGDTSLEGVLAYLDQAAALAASSGPLADLTFAIGLNRAVALAIMGHADQASQALDRLVPSSARARRRIELVRGYAAARSNDLATAEKSFAAAALEEELAYDYRLWISMEIAGLHRRDGRWAEAERAYRDAVSTAERVRSGTGAVELRPHVLARRAAPYLGLVEVLVAQGRGVDALTVAESLHARTWLDVVLGAHEATTPEEALRDAELRRRAQASQPLDRDALMARIGDREALVFLSTGTALLRAHVLHGRVSFTSLTDDERAAVAAFTASPADAVLATRAGAALLPADLIASDQPLYVVASGALTDLPFAALRHADHFLVEERPLARLPGLAMLECRSRAWTAQQVFVGDAAGDLPAAALEVRRQGGSAAFVGARATRAALDGARDAAVLHIAVHGRLSSAGGTLDLADGPFTAATVLESGIAPRVVMLTGCATSASADAEAWTGFPSAFLTAGSQHVIATLRTVGDADAATFARAYYAQPEAAGPVARLAATQRALLHDLPVTAWSSFAVWGAADCGQ